MSTNTTKTIVVDPILHRLLKMEASKRGEMVRTLANQALTEFLTGLAEEEDREACSIINND